jgi:hypothetical protein
LLRAPFTGSPIPQILAQAGGFGKQGCGFVPLNALVDCALDHLLKAQKQEHDDKSAQNRKPDWWAICIGPGRLGA